MSNDYLDLIGGTMEKLGFSHKSWDVVTVASGKGGVGKTLTTINLAMSMTGIGKKVLILDGDLGLSNVNVVLGLEPRYNINDALEHDVPIEKIVLEGPLGIKLIPSGSGITKLTGLSFAKKVRILDAIEDLKSDADVLIIDTGAGIGEDVLHLNAMGDEVVVVTTPEPHAITDAYAFMKVMNGGFERKKFSVLINMTNSIDEGLKVFRKLADVGRRFLDIDLELLGVIPKDVQVQRDVLSCTAGNSNFARTVAGQAWKEATYRLLSSFENENRKLSSRQEFWKEMIFKEKYKNVLSYA